MSTTTTRKRRSTSKSTRDRRREHADREPEEFRELDYQERALAHQLTKRAAEVWMQATEMAQGAMRAGQVMAIEHSARMNPSAAKRLKAAARDLSEGFAPGFGGDEDKFFDWSGIANTYAAANRADYLEYERNQSRHLYWRNPHARGIIETIVSYVCGEELKVSIKHDNEGLREQAREKWKEIYGREDTRFEVRAQELVRRTLRDGEAFNHIAEVKPEDRPPMDAEDATDAELKVPTARWRFGEPEDVQSPRQVKAGQNTTISHGIETAASDPETVLQYWFGEKNPVKAADIRHTKINSDLNARRGVPFLVTVAQRIKDYDTWLTYRLYLNQARAAIACVIYRNSAVSGNDKVLKKLKTGTKTRTLADGSKKELDKYLFDAATTLIMGKDDRIEFQAPNIQAADVKDDGRAILLSIAAGTGMPEYMVTADTSNNNYASSQVAESRGIKTLQWQQRFFLRDVAWIVKRMLGIELGWKGEQLQKLEIDVVGPKIAIRDVLAHARANQIMHQAGVIDTTFWQGQEGIDPEDITAEELATDPLATRNSSDVPRRRSLTDDLPAERRANGNGSRRKVQTNG